MSIIKTDHSLAHTHTRLHIVVAQYWQPCSLFAPSSYFFHHHQYAWMWNRERERERKRTRGRRKKKDQTQPGKRKNELDFCSALYASDGDSCSYVCLEEGKKPRMHAFSWVPTTIMWQNAQRRNRRKEEKKSLVLVAIGIGCSRRWFALLLLHIFWSSLRNYSTRYTMSVRTASKINKHRISSRLQSVRSFSFSVSLFQTALNWTLIVEISWTSSISNFISWSHLNALKQVSRSRLQCLNVLKNR